MLPGTDVSLVAHNTAIGTHEWVGDAIARKFPESGAGGGIEHIEAWMVTVGGEAEGGEDDVMLVLEAIGLWMKEGKLL